MFNFLRKQLVPILLATIWISMSEFVRNELLLKEYWVDHFTGLGLDFPDAPVNGVLWGIWSLLFALFISMVSQKYDLKSTTLIAWFGGFVLMWLVAGNLGFLPLTILYWAVPLSLVETAVAAIIILKMGSRTIETSES